MWSCPYCGGSIGQPFEDRSLRGTLCLNPECGRFDDLIENMQDDWDTTDM